MKTVCPHSLSVFCCNPSDKNWAKSESRSLQKADICDYIISPLGIYPKKINLKVNKIHKKPLMRFSLQSKGLSRCPNLS